MSNREIAHGLVDYLQSDRTRLTFDEAEYLKDEIVTALDAAERRAHAGWLECARFDPTMEGPKFKGWDLSALNRQLAAIRALAKQ